jgi:lipopolysaccharide transport system permease protein
MSTAPTLELKPYSQPAHTLPTEPLAVIQPSRSWNAVKFGELWTYRELLYYFTWRDLKVRYKQTLLGVGWVVMQPLLMTLIFTVFLGMIGRFPAGRIPYPLVVYTGLLVWNFFSITVIGCSYSLVGNANVITKVYFPRVLVPAASVAARLVDLAISFAILFALILFYSLVLHYDLVLSWKLVAVIPLVLLATLLTFGFGMLTSALNVSYRDVGVALPVLLQLWMFVSPVLYPIAVVPERWRRLYSLNPLAGIIDGFRVSIFGGTFNLFALSVSIIATVAILICSAYVFKRVEKTFADLV